MANQANWDAQEKIGYALSRVRTIAEADVTGTAMAAADKHAEYTYLGAATAVEVAHPAVTGGLTLDYDVDNDRTCRGFDRLGRVIEQWWKPTSGSALDHFKYGYDKASSRQRSANIAFLCHALTHSGWACLAVPRHGHLVGPGPPMRPWHKTREFDVDGTLVND